MNITIAGVGYVGLSLAVLLAQNNQITTVTTTEDKAEKLNQFISPIKDPEIERFFSEVLSKKRTLQLHTTTDKKEAYSNADMVIVAAPTNYDEEKHFFDTSAVEDVIENVLKYNPNAVVVIKSTIPVGYTDHIREQYGIKNLLFSPEFLRESMALYDNLHPSRIIVGAHEEQREMAETFAALLKEAALLEAEHDTAEKGSESALSTVEDIPVLICPPQEAESIKLFANTYLAMRVSFFNELDTFASINGMDVASIIEGVCLDPRIGDFYNNPSFGYGGYCLPKDTRQLLANYRNVPQDLIEAIVDSNSTRKKFIAEEVLKEHPETVGIFRLTMKSNSDNYRASAIIDIIRLIKEQGVNVVVFEPTFEKGQNSTFLGCTVTDDLQCFKETSDVILANRYNECLDDVKEKVFTRDLYLRD